MALATHARPSPAAAPARQSRAPPSARAAERPPADGPCAPTLSPRPTGTQRRVRKPRSTSAKSAQNLSGMKLWRQSASLATRRSEFDSRRLHPGLRSVNGSTRPLYGRGAGSTPAGGLLNARSSVESTALIRQRALVRLQPGASRGRSSVGRAPGRHPVEACSNQVVRFSRFPDRRALPPGGAGLRARLAPLSALQPAARVSKHCSTGLRALSDTSGNRE